MTDDSRLVASLADIERHVSGHGWDQPARLFALVATPQLIELEPHLRDRLPEVHDDALTAIEQEDFADGTDLFERLAQIYWPDTVDGVAIALERTMLPVEHEAELPEDADRAAEFVAGHPSRQDVRVVVGVLRDGTRHGLARLKSTPEELLGAQDLVPGLADVLENTLEDPQ